MSKEEQERATSEIARFLAMHRATGENPGGILSPPTDPGTDEEVRLYWHQVQAARRLMDMDSRTTREGESTKPIDRRRASMLAIHEVGTGKTVTAILALAAVHRRVAEARTNHAHDPVRYPPPAATKMVIIAPKTLLSMWEASVKQWTCTSFHKHVLVVREQAGATEQALGAAEVIIVSASALAAAFKVCAKPKPNSHKSKGQSLMRRVTYTPSAHPLFALLPEMVTTTTADGRPVVKASKATPVALTVVDEVHLFLEPSNWTNAAIQQVTTNSRLALGLTGTPVRNDAREIAYLGTLLCVRDPDRKKAKEDWLRFQSVDHYSVEGDPAQIADGAFQAFHAKFVDRVDKSHVDLPRLVSTLVEYDPFVGVDPDGECDADVIERHNRVLRRAKGERTSVPAHDLAPPVPPLASPREADEADEDGEDLPPAAPGDTAWSESQRATFSAMITLGHYELSPVLAEHGAMAFQAADGALYERATQRPSQAMLLIERVMRDRQDNGHARIAVFAESTTQLQIVMRHVERDARFGRLYLFDGRLGDKAQDRMLREFLVCDRGVLFLTKAGGVGINLQTGCACMIAVGSLPWNATDMEQAVGRVYRIGQTRDVEFIQLVARRSISAAKLGLHDDKRLRLSEAAKNNNYANFADNDRAWKWTRRMLDYVAELDRAGNYKVTSTYARTIRDKFNGNKRQRGESAISVPQKPVLPSRMALPSFTV